MNDPLAPLSDDPNAWELKIYVYRKKCLCGPCAYRNLSVEPEQRHDC
jgi:hypothetical protein